MDREKKEFGAWWVWVLFLVILSAITFTVLNYVGIIGKTVVQRKVFENSFQYKEARKSENTIFSAQKAEIDRKLSNPELDANTRVNLEAQAAALRIRMTANMNK